MNVSASQSNGARLGAWCGVLARWGLGALFLYLGAKKVGNPVEFLKLIREYGVISQPWLLNSVAVLLPWCEVVCGVLLLLGVAVRGAVAWLGAMLIPFTGLVVWRAWELQQTSGLPFCAIKFDCGCGAGEVFICRKLLENIFLLGLAGWLLWRREYSLCLRPQLFSAGR